MSLRLCQAVPLAVLLGCSQTTVIAPGGGTGDGGTADAGLPDAGATDAGTTDAGALDAGRMPLVCGGTVCAPDAELCCPIPNCETGEEDLICPLGGFNCPDVEDCPPPEPCEAFDARGEGFCALGFGYAWNGWNCVFLGGCECIGADCGRLYLELETCLDAHAECERGCGSGPACGSRRYCDYPRDSCGVSGEEGSCERRPDACDDIFEPVCGCDGNTYSNRCEAHAAGQDVAGTGAC
ncbi:MAG: hypothetical protein AAGH15_10290 [Myxococcota bacterium]